MLGARVEEPFARRVLAHRAHVVVGRDAANDRRPRLPEVVRAENVGRVVLEQRFLDRDVRRAGIESRRVDLTHAPEIRHALRCHVRPVLAAVARHVHEAVVRPGPDDIDVSLARREREHRGVDLRTVHVVRDRPARVTHRLRIVPGEIAADPLPRVAAIRRLPHVLRRGVEDVGIDVGEDDRVRPLPAFLDRARRLAGEEARVGADLLQLAGAAIQPRDERAVIRAGVVDVEILWIGRDVAGLTAAHLVRRHGRNPSEPAAGDDAASAFARIARHAQRAVVLLRAAHVIRHVLGRDHMVELPGREILGRPRPLRRCDVECDRTAAVVGDGDVLRIVGVDPEVVIVAVRASADRHDRLAAVGRAEGARVQHVDGVLVARVGEHVRVVEGALPDVAAFVDQLPRRAGIIRAVQTAVLVLDERVHAVRIRA